MAFVDIGLPKLSGYEVAREIRRQPGGARITLIALSGYGRLEDKLKALEAGFDAHLTKPVSSAAFQQIVASSRSSNDRYVRTPSREHCEIAPRMLQSIMAADVNATLVTLARLASGFEVEAIELLSPRRRR